MTHKFNLTGNASSRFADVQELPRGPLTLLYDAACPVCALEMDHLRERADPADLRFVDIAAPGFEAARYGATLAELDAEIHGVYADGSVLRGVDALRAAYERAGLGWVLRPTGWRALRPLFDAGYRVFARHRRAISAAAAPLIRTLRARRAKQRAARVAERMRACAAHDGACALPRREPTAATPGSAP